MEAPANSGTEVEGPTTPLSPLEASSAFQQELWAPTLANAMRTPFYASHWEGIDLDQLGLDDIARLPLVTKEQIRSAGPRAQIRDGLVCNEIFTGGTTGPPLVTLKGDREQRYIRRFFHEVYRPFYERPLFRALQINNPYHGHLVPVPVPMHSHKIGIYDGGTFSYGRDVLRREHADREVEPRCTALIGLERCLRAFTADTMEAHPDGIETHLQYVISYSQLLTRRWRGLMESTWGCPVVDRFGMSEVFGGATQDVECGWWFFDPVVVPEVVGLRTHEPIREGIGVLVLTGLYPFQEAQPMIRYWTNDLVEVTHSRSSRPGSLAIRPLGRVRFGVPRPEGDDLWLTPSDILEVVDAEPDVARLPRFVDSPQVRDPYAIGHPRYAVSSSVENGRTRIVLGFVGRAHAELGALRARLHDGLVAASPALRDGIDAGEVTLEVRAVDDLQADLISHAG